MLHPYLLSVQLARSLLPSLLSAKEEYPAGGGVRISEQRRTPNHHRMYLFHTKHGSRVKGYKQHPYLSCAPLCQDTGWKRRAAAKTDGSCRLAECPRS